ncbi:MAG: hypothetical protein ABIZ64_02750 [Casimicrobium sp.]|jgi:hypothetical protein
MASTMERSDRAQMLRRRNLRTGWVLAAIALMIALSIWYVRAS